MKEKSLSKPLMNMIKRTVNRVIDAHTQLEKENWNLESIVDFANSTLVHEDGITFASIERKTTQEIKEYLDERAQEVFNTRAAQLNGPEQLLEFEKVVILRVVDSKRTDHIDTMNQLRQSISLRAYGQNNPLVEYQTEDYKVFKDMVDAVKYEVTRIFIKAEIHQNVQREQVSQETASHSEDGDAKENNNTSAKKQPIHVNKVGRNDPCPCGSGKKYRGCYGRNAN